MLIACSMTLESICVQTQQAHAHCRQEGHLHPSSLSEGAGHQAYCLLCLGWICTHCSLVVGKFPLLSVQKGEVASIRRT